MTQHVKRAISNADAARMKGCSRAAVTQAVRRGRLGKAVLTGGRLDAAHPAFLAWLADHAKTSTPSGEAKASAEPPAGRRRGRSRRGLEPARPTYPVSREALAIMAGLTDTVIDAAARGPLAAACLDDGRFDIAHPAVLAMMAAFPFERDARGEVALASVPAGFFGGAVLEADQLDFDHPALRCFLARSWGRVPTDDDLAEVTAEAPIPGVE